MQALDIAVGMLVGLEADPDLLHFAIPVGAEAEPHARSSTIHERNGKADP